jgi:diguanylate cyclase (GGDEF)-like protein/PAS domain S-box-containing protein
MTGENCKEVVQDTQSPAEKSGLCRGAWQTDESGHCLTCELIEASPDPVFALDALGRIVSVNRAVEDATGLSCSQLSGANFASCFSDEREAEELFRRTVAEKNIRNIHLSIRHSNGGHLEVSCNANVYRAEDGGVAGVFVVAHDVQEIKLYQSQMMFQAHFDTLTALPNRVLFMDRLQRALNPVRRDGSVVAVMLIDLDNFKDVNDTLGHFFGDEVLKAMAQRIQLALGGKHTVARLGGDEFSVLVEGIMDTGDVDRFADELLKSIAAPLKVNGHEVVVGCSMGITLVPFDDSDSYGLLRNADTAMYRAKADGKNTYRYFTAEMHASVRRRLDIGNRLRRSISANGTDFALHYQPRVDLASGEVTGVEALLRWNAPGLGPVSPGEFIPIAEKNGTIVEIGDWVLLNACRQAKCWFDEFGAKIPVAVNLSARQFRDVDVAGRILRVLEQTGLPPNLLELELTESMLMNDANRVLNTLDVIRDIGVRLSVDDFGTGYSSLSYLKGFPLDYLKIDRSFVADIPGDPNDKAIVQAIIGIAHNLGMKVIAEGVETGEQVEFMLMQDCDEIQGFYFCKPLPVDEITEMLRGERRLDADASCQASRQGNLSRGG